MYPRDLGVPDKEPIIEAAAQLTGPHDYGPWKTMDQSTLGNKGQPLWLKTNASVKRGPSIIFRIRLMAGRAKLSPCPTRTEDNSFRRCKRYTLAGTSSRM